MNVKILQWNVWTQEDPDNIAKEIKRIRADIVCAQELIQNFKKEIDTAKYIADKLSYNYFFKEADTWSGREDKDTQGNAIFAKFPIVTTSYTYLQEPKHNPPDASCEGRVYIEVGTKIENCVLSIGTTHLSYSHCFAITEHRRKEVDNLVKIVGAKESNYILAGDLNSTPNSYTIQQLSQHLKHAGPDFRKRSWTTKPFEYQGFKENDLNWRLDYLFATEDIEVKNVKTTDTPFSDHLPILAQIEL